jgi:hypothetical protein
MPVDGNATPSSLSTPDCDVLRIAAAAVEVMLYCDFKWAF